MTMVKKEDNNVNDNEKKVIYIINNFTNFDFFAVLTPPKKPCMLFSLEHF